MLVYLLVATRSSIPMAAIALASGCAAMSEYTFAADGSSGGSLMVALEGGRVELASLGVVEVSPHAGASTAALHIRIALTNQRDPEWTFDTGAQRVVFPGDKLSPAMFVNADTRELPIAAIRQGEHRVFDFLFAMPPPLADADDLATFELRWRLVTAGGPIERTVHFHRSEARPTYRQIGSARYWRYNVVDPWPQYLVVEPGASTAPIDVR